MREAGLCELFANEALSGGVDVFAGNLTDTVTAALLTQTCDLLFGVAGRHVGHAGNACIAKDVKQLFKIAY